MQRKKFKSEGSKRVINMQEKEMKNVCSENKEKVQNELLNEYRNQTQVEGKHDYHVDGYYGDYSESSCCC